MIEVLVAAAVFTLLAITALVREYVAWFVLLKVGVWMIAGGVGLSVSAGLVYHVALYRALVPRGALSNDWWWAPTRFHGALTRQERPQVLSWFYLGAAGFGVVMMGCVVVLLAALRDLPP